MEFLTLQDVPRYHHRSAMTFRERSPPLHLAKQHEAAERMKTNPSLPPFSELLKFSKSSPDSQSAHIKSPPAAVDHWQAPSARTSRQSSAERPVFNDPFRGAPPPHLASHSSTHHPRPTENYTMQAEGRPSLLQARPSANYESCKTSLRADYEPRIPSESRHSLPSPFNPRVSPPAAVTQVYHQPPGYAAAIPITEAHRYTEAAYGPIAYHNEYHTPRAHFVSERVPVRHDSTVFTGSGHHWPPPPPHYAYPPGYGYVIDHNVPENYPGGRRRRGNLPKEATALLKKWFQDHAESPYPSDEEKTNLASSTGLSQAQISNWFINARRRNPGKEAREMTRAMNNNRSSGQQQAQGTNGSQEQDLSVQPSASSSPQQTRPSQQHREQHYVLPQITAPQPYHYDPRDHKQDRDHEMGNT